MPIQKFLTLDSEQPVDCCLNQGRVVAVAGASGGTKIISATAQVSVLNCTDAWGSCTVLYR